MAYVRFAIHDSTGKIIRAGIALDVDAQAMVEPGQEIKYLDNDEPRIAAYSHSVDMDTGKFVEVALSPVVRDKKAQSLSDACAGAIVAGFMVGTKFYPSGEVDQRNMLQISVTGGDLWSRTGAVWSLDTYAAGEATTILTAFGTMRDAARNHLATLQDTLSAATTQSAIDALEW